MDPAFWNHKKVLVTGHTGFKGSWLSLWLQSLGAEVVGLALEPPSQPNLFEIGAVGAGMDSVIGDIRDRDTVAALMQRSGTEIVFHLAAQSLVRYSYSEPLETFSTNVMGTAKVLDAARHTESVRTVVAVTTDKCYENLESEVGYREEDRLGGHDPYAASKACAELVIAAYRRSYFTAEDRRVALASARAGNVIGGGDWAADRLIPDVLRGIVAGEPVLIRSPDAVRPWQHVVEPLAGYLRLAEALSEDGSSYSEAWNFGPGEGDLMTVGEVTKYLTRAWGPAARWTLDATQQPHETRFLRLDSGKARERLGWTARLSTRQALDWVVDWHRAHQDGADMKALTLRQIGDYLALAAELDAGTTIDTGIDTGTDARSV